MPASTGPSVAGPQSPAAGGPSAPAEPTHPIRPPSAKGRTVAVAAIVVVVILVVGLLFWLGVFSGTAAGLAGVATYSSAQGAAAGATKGAPGGPWTIVAAGGIAVPGNLTIPAENISSSSIFEGCSFGWVGTPPAAVTIPATPSGTTPGKAAAWLFLATNASQGVLVTLVANATATNLFTVSGSCTSDLDVLSAIPAGVVDSTSAAASANSAGGTTFLKAHPTSAEAYAIASTGSPPFSLSVWEVVYTTCTSLSETGTPGFEFNVTLDATNGEVLLPAQTTSVTCTAPALP